MTFYKQFQTDFPTYIIKIVKERENCLSRCAHQHLWKLSRGGGSVKQVVYLDPVGECYDMAFPQYSTKWNLPNKKRAISNKELIKILSNSIKKNVENWKRDEMVHFHYPDDSVTHHCK